MGLAHRIVPVMLCRGRTLVKGKQFNAWRSVGVASQAVRIHQMRGVDELVLLDIAATAEHRGPDLQLVRELTEICFMPLAVGGGVRSVEDVRALLRAGADKVVICSAPEIIKPCAEIVGCQAIVAAIDVRGRGVYSHAGTFLRSTHPRDWAKKMQDQGAGEILLTSIDREGTMSGYDIELIESVRDAVTIPVVANGGCGSYEHMRQAIEAGASAVAAGAFFQFTESTPKGAATFLHERGIEARV